MGTKSTTLLPMEVTMPGTPSREFVDIWAASIGIKGFPQGVAAVVNPSMAPYGGFTGIPGVHTRAADLAFAINFNWHVFYGSHAPVMTVEEAAQYLPGNPKGPTL